MEEAGRADGPRKEVSILSLRLARRSTVIVLHVLM